MESLQERLNELISSNANKIADWAFPLSEKRSRKLSEIEQFMWIPFLSRILGATKKTLEEYNQGLMEHEKNLNYSETALIIQNATNVLGKRIDRLHLDTSGLRNSLNEHEVQNEAAKASKPRQKSHHPRLDLDDIKHPDLQKEISKSCFLKSKKSKKKIKLLSQRYPQLENMCRHKFSLDVIDIQGEKIGKKYDFRCNQQLTSSHMLVDELSPDDLQEQGLHDPLPLRESPKNPVQNSSDSLSLLKSPMREEAAETSDLEADEFCEPDGTQESGYCTLPDLSMTSEDMSQNLTPSTDVGEKGSGGDAPVSSRGTAKDQVAASGDPGHTGSQGHPGCPASPGHLEAPTPPGHPGSPISPENPEHPGHPGSPTNPGSPTPPENPEHLGHQTQPGSPTHPGPLTHLGHPGPLTPPETPESPKSPTPSEKKRNRESVDTDAGYTSGGPEELQSPEPLRRSKRQRKSANEKTFQAIPFNSPIPERIPKGRSEFKLPCHISLLKTTRKRKRRCNVESVKREKLAKFLMNENESENRNKLLMYSPSRPLFGSPKHETEEFQKVFEERFKKRLDLSVCTFDAVLNDDDDLKGFSRRGSSAGTGGGKRGVEMSGIIDDRLQEIQEASCSYTPPHSPFFSGDFRGDEDEVESARDFGGLTHQERIEERMRELRREFDVRNDREDESARWLQAMETLRAAERRPVYNVRDYEGRIVKRLREEEGKIGFEEVTWREDPEDIARLFVASLHLANTYTVDITPSDDTSNLSLSLKKTERSQTSYHL